MVDDVFLLLLNNHALRMFIDRASIASFNHVHSVYSRTIQALFFSCRIHITT